MSERTDVPLTPDQRHTPEQWRADLIAAGWREVSLHVWESPDGWRCRGPYGAWCQMLIDSGKVSHE